MSSIVPASDNVCDRRPRLLITLRSRQELAAVPWWWAAVLDFKEPRLGALGPVEQTELTAIKSALAAERRANPHAANTEISVACGEWWELERSPDWRTRLTGVHYAKLGWSSSGACPVTARETIWEKFAEACERAGCRPVPVLYSDLIDRPETTLLQEVSQLIARGCREIFVDTWDKSAGRLSDWASAEELSRAAAWAKQRGVAVGLAGSLRPKDLDWLLPLPVNWLGFRSAVAESNREGTVTETSWKRFFEEVHSRLPHASSASRTQLEL